MGDSGLAATTDDELSTREAAKIIDSLVTRGDWSGLGPVERARAYTTICVRLGLDPYSQPFEFLRLNGKEVMYARRGATDQLAAKHHVTREIIDGPKVIDLGGTKLVYCVAKASLPGGRFETATATVPLVDPVNVLMKCETKAKRRATLSLLGLGCLDESETDTIPGAVRIDAAQVEPRQLEGAPAQPAPLDALDAFRAVLAECGDLATIAAAYQGAGLGGTSAKDVGAVVRDRTAALGYHLNAADVTALLGGSMPSGTVLAYDRLAAVERRADDADGDAVVAEVVRVLRDCGGLDAPTRIKTAAVATCTALDVVDAAKRIASALRPTPPSGPGGGQRTLATQAPADVAGGCDADVAPTAGAQASANDGPRCEHTAEELAARILRPDAEGDAAWREHLAATVAEKLAAGADPRGALAQGYAKRRFLFTQAGGAALAMARESATVDEMVAHGGDREWNVALIASRCTRSPALGTAVKVAA